MWGRGRRWKGSVAWMLGGDLQGGGGCANVRCGSGGTSKGEEDLQGGRRMCECAMRLDGILPTGWARVGAAHRLIWGPSKL